MTGILVQLHNRSGLVGYGIRIGCTIHELRPGDWLRLFRNGMQPDVSGTVTACDPGTVCVVGDCGYDHDLVRRIGSKIERVDGASTDGGTEAARAVPVVRTGQGDYERGWPR